MRTIHSQNSTPRAARFRAHLCTAILAFLATALAGASVTPAQVSPIDLGDVQGAPLIAVDVFDNIDVAMLSATGVSFTQSTDGGNTFSGPVTVATSTTLAGLQMGLDNQGKIYLLWQDWPTQQAFVSVSNDGVTFSTPTRFRAGAACGLGPCTTDPHVYPQLAVSPSGNVTVAFFGTPGTPHDGPFSAISVDGGATFITVSVAAFVVRQVVNVTGPNDEQYVIWGSPNGQIYASASLDAGQTFSPAVNISNDPDASSLAPYAIVDSSGNLDVAWQKAPSSTDPNRKLMFTTSTDQGSTFSTPVAAFTSTEFVVPSQEQIVVDNGGGIDVVVAPSHVGSGTITYVRSTDGGGTFSAPQALGSGLRPAITLDACGGVNVAWNADSTPADIFLANAADDAAFSASTDLTMNPGGVNSFLPRLAADSVGNIFAAWQHQPSPGVSRAFFAVAGACGF